MESISQETDLEKLCDELNDSELLDQYKEPYDAYKPSFLPRILGAFLVWSGNVIYGKEPSYLKFRAVEVIARVPYQSWAAAAYTLLTLFYTDEDRACRLADLTTFARCAQDNETMHVVVISHLTAQETSSGFFRHTLIPLVFSFFYFWVSYVLYFIRSKYSYELNYIFEQHAFEQYDRFLELYKEELMHKPITSTFLERYGRNPRSQYEFFQSVRNDELIHRNTSIKKIQTL